MHKLTRVEAERVMAVLQETLDKLDLLRAIPKSAEGILHCKERAGPVLKEFEPKCPGLCAKISELWTQEKLMAPTTRVAVRSVMRALQSDGAGREMWMEQVPENPGTQRLYEALEDLKTITFRKLSTTVEDANMQKTYTEEMRARHKKAAEDHRALSEQLEKIRGAKDEEISRLDNQERKMRGELAYMKQMCDESESSLAKETASASTLAKGQFEATTAQLTARIAKLKEELALKAEDTAAKEQTFRKKTTNSQREVQSWIVKYDKDMSEKQAAIDEVKAKHKKELAELAELKKYFKKWDAEHARIQAEEHEVALIRQAKLEKEKYFHDAATKLQSTFRGFHQQKQFKKVRKKGKKGKKKKKK